MQSLLDVARGILDRHPSPALPYTEVHRLICAERPGPPPDPDFLLSRIRARGDLFRVVEPWRGPWRRLTGTREASAEEYRNVLAGAGLPVDLWIVSAAGARTGPENTGSPRSLAERVRATLLDLSRRIDAGSPAALDRWIRLLSEGRALAGCLDRG